MRTRLAIRVAPDAYAVGCASVLVERSEESREQTGLFHFRVGLRGRLGMLSCGRRCGSRRSGRFRRHVVPVEIFGAKESVLFHQNRRRIYCRRPWRSSIEYERDADAIDRHVARREGRQRSGSGRLAAGRLDWRLNRKAERKLLLRGVGYDQQLTATHAGRVAHGVELAAVEADFAALRH